MFWCFSWGSCCNYYLRLQSLHQWIRLTWGFTVLDAWQILSSICVSQLFLRHVCVSLLCFDLLRRFELICMNLTSHVFSFVFSLGFLFYLRRFWAAYGSVSLWPHAARLLISVRFAVVYMFISCSILICLQRFNALRMLLNVFALNALWSWHMFSISVC